MRFLENKQEDGEQMRRSIEVDPYVRQLILDPDKPDQPNAIIIKLVIKMSEINKKQYYVDIRVMNYLIQRIPNDIYNSIDACKIAHQMCQYEPHVIAKRTKQSARNHDPLALVAHSNVYNLQSHAKPSYSHSSQLYYVTHPSSLIDYKEDYQGEIQGDAQEDNLTTAMMLVARAITQHYSTPTNNQETEQKSSCYCKNGMVQQMEANDQTIQRDPQTESNTGKPNMLLALKDETGGNLKEEENDSMLDNYYGDDTLEELNAAVFMMARIQPTNDTGVTSSRSNAEILSKVNASNKHNKSQMPFKSGHEHKNLAKLKTIINTYSDGQINSSIIFDDPYVEDNGRDDEHDQTTHDQYTFKERVKTLEKQPVKALNYKDVYEELEREIRANKDKIDNLTKEKAKLHDECAQQEYATLIIQNETELPKKAFKERENSFLEEIVDLTEQLSEEMSDLPMKNMPNESKLLNLFVKLEKTIGQLQTGIDETLLKDRSRTLIFDNQDELRQFYKTRVIPMSITLRRCSNEIIQKIKEEVKNMFDIFKSMKKVGKQSQTDKIFHNEIDRLLETSLTREIRDCVLLSVENKKNEMLILEIEKISSDSKDIQATIEKRIKILENDFKRAEAQYFKLDLKMQHQTEKMTCDVSWKSKMTKLIDENVLLKKSKLESTVNASLTRILIWTHSDFAVQNWTLRLFIFSSHSDLGQEEASSVKRHSDFSTTYSDSDGNQIQTFLLNIQIQMCESDSDSEPLNKQTAPKSKSTSKDVKKS
ncbi:hypothetical protein Tco_0489939 [Tanacetum coccineum]